MPANNSLIKRKLSYSGEVVTDALCSRDKRVGGEFRYRAAVHLETAQRSVQIDFGVQGFSSLMFCQIPSCNSKGKPRRTFRLAASKKTFILISKQP